MLYHLFGNINIGDHAVAQRPDGFDAIGRFPHHQFRVIANRFYALDPVQCFNCNHRRLVEHNALSAHIHDGVGGAEVNRHVLRGEAEKRHFEHVVSI